MSKRRRQSFWATKRQFPIMSKKLTHIDADGNATMVDVSDKDITGRVAIAEGRIKMEKETLELIKSGEIAKGDVLSVARLAGIMAAKRTADLIPLCHPLALNKVSVEFEIDDADTAIKIIGTAKVSGRTGVEMEALTAVSVTALTIYDMAKAVDRSMMISDIRLVHKSGGKSGTYDANR